MTDKRQSDKKPKVEKLELDKETIQDLTESEAEAAAGGRKKPPDPITPRCLTRRPMDCPNDSFSPARCGTQGITFCAACPVGSPPK